MVYSIERLRTDEDYFLKFLHALPKDWQRNVCDVDTFLRYFDKRDTSCEIFRTDGQTDEQIYEEQGDNAEVEAVATVEIGMARFIELYGIETLVGWDNEEKCYGTSYFGDYKEINVQE